MTFCDLGVTFDLWLCWNVSTALYETYFSYHNNILTATTTYYMQFYLILLSALTDTHILKLINLTAS